MTGTRRGIAFCCAASCLLLLFALPDASATGLASRWLLSQWHRRVWQIEDGLPHNYVTAISYDSDRDLLIGTQTGLVRFDGMHFTPLSEWRDVWIYSLLRATDGTLWVGTYQQGLYRITGNQVQKWGLSHGFKDLSVYSLVEDRRHCVWLTSETGLHVVNGNQVQLVGSGGDTNGYAWQSAALDRSGAVWFAADNGLQRRDNGVTTAIKLSGVSGQLVTAYFWGAENRLYVSTVSQLYVLRCSGDHCEGHPVPDVSGPVVGLRGVSDGALWVATWGRGLYRLTGNRVEHLSTREGLPDDFVRVVQEDNEGNVWVGTRGGGLTRFRATALKPVGIPEGLGGNCASVATGDGSDGMWLGTWRSGLFHWRNGSLRPQSLTQPPLGILITSLALDRGGNLWIGSMENLWMLPAHSKRSMEMPLPGRQRAAISHILARSNGELWFAKDGYGIFRFHSADIRRSAPSQLLVGQTVTAILEDGSGNIWIGSEQGLWKMKKDGVAGPELIDRRMRNVTAISQDSQMRIWAASRGGYVMVYQGTSARQLRYENLPAPEIYSILEDDRDGMWFGTGRGLARANLHDIDTALLSDDKQVSFSPYGVAEGMRTIECRCAKQPQSWKMNDGTIWVPTAKGFIQIDQSRAESSRPPQPVMEAITLDGKTVAPDQGIYIQPGRHELQAHFSAIRLGLAEGVRFRYRMAGLEPDWIKADSIRMARYGQLPPGHFQFLVSARDAGGMWSDPISVRIEQRPSFYQTGWFRASLVAGLVLIMVLAVQLRLRILRARYAAVIGERNRIAREFHDTLLAGLSAVSWQIDAALELCQGQVAEHGLTNAKGMLRYCRDEARRAVGALRDEPEPEPPLAVAIENALDQMVKGTQVKASVNAGETLPSIPADLALDLVRICQEATSNAMRHGQASVLWVQLQFGGDLLTLSIKDNGVGMISDSTDKPLPGHFGVLGMRERVHRFGGKLTITSTPNAGTMVEAVIPLPV